MCFFCVIIKMIWKKDKPYDFSINKCWLVFRFPLAVFHPRPSLGVRPSFDAFKNSNTKVHLNRDLLIWMLGCWGGNECSGSISAWEFRTVRVMECEGFVMAFHWAMIFKLLFWSTFTGDASQSNLLIDLCISERQPCKGLASLMIMRVG